MASALVRATADFVKEQLESNDASHDWQHIQRVWTLARVLAKEEVGVPHTPVLVVELISAGSEC